MLCKLKGNANTSAKRMTGILRQFGGLQLDGTGGFNRYYPNASLKFDLSVYIGV